MLSGNIDYIAPTNRTYDKYSHAIYRSTLSSTTLLTIRYRLAHLPNDIDDRVNTMLLWMKTWERILLLYI